MTEIGSMRADESARPRSISILTTYSAVLVGARGPSSDSEPEKPSARPNLRLILVASSVVTLLLTSCGGDDETQPEASSESSVAANEVSTTASPEPESEDAAGTDGEWQAVIDAAVEEGQLTFYSSEVDSVNAAVVEAFTEKYPQIQVEWQRLVSGPLATRFLEEQDAGINAVDVIRVGGPELLDERPDLFLELTEDVLPILAEYPEEAWRFPHAVATQTSVYSINYNTESVGDNVPDSWQDLLDDRFRDGHLLFTWEPGHSTALGHLEGMRENYGDEWLEAFGEMGFDLVESSGPGNQQVAAGAYALNVSSYPGHATPLIEEGAPIDYAIPTDPILLNRDNLAIPVDAPHPNAARLFADFRLSREGLEAACGANQLAPLLADVEGCMVLPDGEVYYVQDLFTEEEGTEIAELAGLPTQ